jgi:hypothetical protein
MLFDKIKYFLNKQSEIKFREQRGIYLIYGQTEAQLLDINQETLLLSVNFNSKKKIYS